MKKLLLITAFFLLCTVSMYSQSRTHTISTSPYQPITDTRYYEALAKRKAEHIKEKSISLQKRVDNYINTTNDHLFRTDLYEVKSYLNPIFNNKIISISNAEWYLKKGRKKFNRAIRKYNKRLKKKQKN
tara:strand:+ start:1170 stop:1556 length:387 start_codon:yes stop_codon:yes gene_type:complete